MDDYAFMFDFAKKESILYTEEELPYVEQILKRHKMVYTIFNAKTNECVTPYPAKIIQPIDIALTEVQSIKS
jgi:hypothetical protein